MTTTSEQITRRIFDDSIPTFYSRTGNLYELLKSFADEHEIIYDNIAGLIQQININTMTGKFLDELGKIFNLSRDEGETDDQYRAKFRSFWVVLSGGGTLEGIKNAITLLIGINADDITITGLNLIITINVQIDYMTNVNILEEIPVVMNLAKPAGVYYNNKVNISSKNNIFITNLSSINGPDTLL